MQFVDPEFKVPQEFPSGDSDESLELRCYERKEMLPRYRECNTSTNECMI